MLSGINALVQAVYDAGLTAQVHYGFHLLGLVACLVHLIILYKRYRIKYSLFNALWVTGTIWIMGYMWCYVLAWMESGFTEWGSTNIIRTYVYLPLFALLPTLFFDVKWGTVVDVVAPCACLSQGITHFGCVFSGCCSGYECVNGLWNAQRQVMLFPIQIIESLVSLGIYAIVVHYQRKHDYNCRGLSFPLFLVLFGSTRFVLEFYRWNYKVIGKVSVLALHAAFMVLVGAIWFAIDTFRHRKKPAKVIVHHKRR